MSHPTTARRNVVARLTPARLPVWPIWTREDVRAGWIDAARTPAPRVLGGWRVGALDYAAGFAAWVVASRLSGRAGRIVERVAAVVIIVATLALSVTAAPDAAATTADSSSGHAAYRAAVSVVLPVCEHEDGSDCRQAAGDWTAVRVGAGLVFVDFADPGMTDELVPDAYPPADS